MKATGINRVIEDFSLLLPEEKEFALDIIQKIVAESKREAISKRAKKAASNYKKGKAKSGSAKDLYNDLERD